MFAVDWQPSATDQFAAICVAQPCRWKDTNDADNVGQCRIGPKFDRVLVLLRISIRLAAYFVKHLTKR